MLLFVLCKNGFTPAKKQGQSLFKMPQCFGFKTDGERCNRNDSGEIHAHAPHLRFCRTHWGVYERRVRIRRRLTIVVDEQHHHIGSCHHWVANRYWCPNQCEQGLLLCATHHQRFQEHRQREELLRQRAREDTEFVETTFAQYRALGMNSRQALDDLFANGVDPNLRRRIARMLFVTLPLAQGEFEHQWQFNFYLQWDVMGRVAPVPNLLVPPLAIPQHVPPANNLGAIALDRQNVHTSAVSQQTNKGLEKLLAETNGTTIQRAPEWFAARWLLKSYGDWGRVSQVVADMLRWYNMQTCRTNGDWLYRKTLDGLYLTIRKLEDSDIKTELFKRTFEECFESVGMCCDGHISRLCNVLVGFDEAFAPPVPLGELLQSKMAAIAAMDVDTEEKIRQATAFFNENSVPEADRAAWLEAF